MFKSDKLPKYALRKLTVGVASVMIGMTIFSFGNPNFVKAATSNGDNPASDKSKSKSADDSINKKTLTLHTPGAHTSSTQSTTASSAAKSSAAHELSAASSADLTPASSANSAAQSQSTNADSQAIASANSEAKVDSAVNASSANSATSASSASASTAANDSTSVPASDKPMSATSKSAAKSVTLKKADSAASAAIKDVKNTNSEQAAHAEADQSATPASTSDTPQSTNSAKQDKQNETKLKSDHAEQKSASAAKVTLDSLTKDYMELKKQLPSMTEQERNTALTALKKEIAQLSAADQMKLASFIGTRETTPNLDSAKVTHLGIVKLTFSTEDQPAGWWTDKIDYKVPEGYELQYKWQNFLYPIGSNPSDTNDPMNYYDKNGIIVKLVNKSTGRTVDQKLFPVITLAVHKTYADYFNFAKNSDMKAFTHALEPGSVPGSDRQLAASPDMLTKMTIGDVTYTGQELVDAGILNNIVWSMAHNTPASSDGKEDWTTTAGITLIFNEKNKDGDPITSRQFNIDTTIRSAKGTAATFATTKGNNTWHTIDVGNGADDKGNANKGVRNANHLGRFNPTYTWLKDMPHVTPGMTAAQIIADHKLMQEDVSKLEAGPHTLYVLVSYSAETYKDGVATTRPDGYQIVKVQVNSLNQIIHVQAQSPVNIHAGQLDSDFDTDSAASHISAWYTDFDGQKKNLTIDPSQFGHNDYPIKSITWDQKPGSYVDPKSHKADNTKASIKVVYADSVSDHNVDQSIVTVNLDKATAKTGLEINGGATVDNSINSALQSRTSVDGSQVTRWQPSYE
ncbi:YSIRK-type signal peptide-containing protein [Limosilactobacillus secaliphilus]|uniref:LPXTG-motif cell wall anchor domain protein n=1 Tax=Limosilactobacillus secaliphilus TaxID=396268 RepID=A0A0R2I1A0_9LACO|nr:YSIRK-type signal peptide-containing protein [Limosilactobacillus secaliphilus]KRN58944.1 LPXTG-motif cell wall anchor domain protein [Limosilactobacillus secaliphilus]